ncbi:MAG: hypothetical protein HC849_05760 [Oscillatoriales cyanobacterium RU_3_3]|nr:hypothetical protein [Oscillatoriales cyanobacterium RU_3_3]
MRRGFLTPGGIAGKRGDFGTGILAVNCGELSRVLQQSIAGAIEHIIQFDRQPNSPIIQPKLAPSAD